MFINKLDGCEKQILMDLFVHVAGCDNEFPNDESNYILGIRDKYNLKMKFRVDDVKDLCVKITKNKSKLIIIQELIRAAIIDGDFHPCEKDIIEDVSGHFDIGTAKYSEIEEWVEKGINWFSSGDDIIGDPDII